MVLPQTGTLLNVKPKSKLGKYRITIHGELFRLTKTKDKVEFSDKPGPWLQVESLRDTRHSWWINENDDDDFNVIEKITANEV